MMIVIVIRGGVDGDSGGNGDNDTCVDNSCGNVDGGGDASSFNNNDDAAVVPPATTTTTTTYGYYNVLFHY